MTGQRIAPATAPLPCSSLRRLPSAGFPAAPSLPPPVHGRRSDRRLLTSSASSRASIALRDSRRVHVVRAGSMLASCCCGKGRRGPHPARVQSGARLDADQTVQPELCSALRSLSLAPLAARMSAARPFRAASLHPLSLSLSLSLCLSSLLCPLSCPHLPHCLQLWQLCRLSALGRRP